LKTEGRIFISDRAHVVFDVHQQVDGLEEVELGQGFIGMLVLREGKDEGIELTVEQAPPRRASAQPTAPR
jgi:hypothetical protein